MAKDNNGAKLVSDWAKAQAVTEQAAEALETARTQSQAFARGIYEAFGTEPFYVKALGRKYRAIHKRGGVSKKGVAIAEQWVVIPLAENAPTREF